MTSWPNDGKLSALNIRRACDASLRRLRTDYIDVYQMHHVDRATPWDEIWQAMQVLVTQGKVLYVGSSNFAGWDIARACETARARDFTGLVSEQSLYNLMTRAIELEIGPPGAPILHTPSVVSMGNPHAIFWVEDPTAYDLAKIGPLLENHPLFPERANITLAAIPARDHIVMRTWERGAGLTKACGSAACASAVAAVRLRRTGRKVRVSLPGGDLTVEWRESDEHVLMTGPVEYEHKGRFAASLTAAGAV